MITKKIQKDDMLAEEEVKTSLEMEHLSVMLQELLGLITELGQVPTPGTTQVGLIGLRLIIAII